MSKKNTVGHYYGLKDARGMRGILSRGPAKYVGPGKAGNVGKIFDVQKAAQHRIKKLQDSRRIR